MSQVTLLPRRRHGQAQEEYVALSYCVCIANIKAAGRGRGNWARVDEEARGSSSQTIDTPRVFVVADDGETYIERKTPSAAIKSATKRAGLNYIKARQPNVHPDDDELQNAPKPWGILEVTPKMASVAERTISFAALKALHSGTVARYCQTELAYSQRNRLGEDHCFATEKGLGIQKARTLLIDEVISDSSTQLREIIGWNFATHAEQGVTHLSPERRDHHFWSHPTGANPSQNEVPYNPSLETEHLRDESWWRPTSYVNVADRVTVHAAILQDIVVWIKKPSMDAFRLFAASAQMERAKRLAGVKGE